MGFRGGSMILIQGFARSQAPAWERSRRSSRQPLPASPKAPTVGALPPASMQSSFAWVSPPL